MDGIRKRIGSYIRMMIVIHIGGKNGQKIYGLS